MPLFMAPYYNTVLGILKHRYRLHDIAINLFLGCLLVQVAGCEFGVSG